MISFESSDEKAETAFNGIARGKKAELSQLKQSSFLYKLLSFHLIIYLFIDFLL